MNIIRTFALPLVVGAVVVGGAAYIAKKNSSKVISMVDAVRTWINKKLSKNVAEAEIVAPAASAEAVTRTTEVAQ